MTEQNMRITPAISVFLFSIMSFAGCGSGSSDSFGASRSYMMGIAPIPRNLNAPAQSSDWLDMLGKISSSAEIVTAQDPWQDASTTPGSIPSLITLIGGQKSSYSYEVMYGINFFTQSGTYEPILSVPANPANNWGNTEAKALYRQTVFAICNAYHPKYLALAFEVNSYYLNHSADYALFVSYYKSLYDEVKALYPNTNVFVTFQLEMMNGIGDSTWGVSVDPQWDLIADYDGKLDMLVFTSYPEVQYTTPEAIPSDYYADIKTHTNKPIAISEVGWSSSKNSESDQNRFLGVLMNQMKVLNPVFVSWIFMHDPATSGTLNQTGLRNYDGSTKAAWSTWCSYKSIPYK